MLAVVPEIIEGTSKVWNLLKINKSYDEILEKYLEHTSLGTTDAQFKVQDVA